ncbi:MAG: alpha/beta hydrolase-fold protein [Solirubrobacteraceae bacterium]
MSVVARRRAAALLVLAAVAYGGWRLYERFWPFGDIHSGSARAHGAQILRYDIRSRFARRTLPQTAIAPDDGADGRPLLVFLHGRGGGGNEGLANEDFLAALADLGDRAPAVVFPSGGDHSYWHARADGDWASYVLREVIPEAVRRLHADPRRVAIGGISMGGYGAYEVARVAPGRFCAVGGHSAAMWLSGGETPAGAFDDAADFAARDLVALATQQGSAPWKGARLWLDGGDRDPFLRADTTLADGLGIRMHVWPGGHESAYWHAHYAAYLRFYAGALARCRRE